MYPRSLLMRYNDVLSKNLTLRDLLTNLFIDVFSSVTESEGKKTNKRLRITKKIGSYRGSLMKYHEHAANVGKIIYK